ncbi:unnamed protein product, partial [Didymodactylos carnosus]
MPFACNDGFPLNERFLCNDKKTCLKPMQLCNHVYDCFDGEDESEYWCGKRPPINSSICKEKTCACQEQDDSGPCIPQADCYHAKRESCRHSHRDDHMCIHPRKYNQFLFGEKYIPFSPTEPINSTDVPPWYCDRGLKVYRYRKPTCLCPPSFYGHRCEKHSHRLTAVFTLNIELIKADLIRIHVRLNNHHETIDHILLTQHPSYT